MQLSLHRLPVPRAALRQSLCLLLPACGDAATCATAQALSPDEALKRFKMADGFEVQLFASEPMVRQPVTMTFDDRGRMWVIQYLQYPNPAGLKPVEVDQYLRTKYDRVPEPPPHGPRGADRITILEDTDGDGRVDKAKDFVTGLNLASALALGHGGVYVGQAPYLLFYPDRDRRRRARRRSRGAAHRASAWRTRTPWPTRCSGAPTAGSTARRAAP